MRLKLDVPRAVELVLAGKSYQEVGALLGVTGSAVVQYFRSHPSLPRSTRRSKGYVPLRRCWECYRLTRQPTCPGCGLTFEGA